MTNQIDELMRLADVYAATPMWNNSDQNRATLREALEAALKPGEPYGYVFNTKEEDIAERMCGELYYTFPSPGMIPLYTAPPAQTPCKWPTCQTEEYQQKLSDDVASELIGAPTAQDHIGDANKKVAEPEQSEPVYAFRRNGMSGFCTCDERLYLELQGKPHLFEVAIFYREPPRLEPLTTEKYTELAHRIASKYTHRSDPAFTGYTFLPHTLEQFVRSVEEVHGIGVKP